jgi:hypothetical protein
MEIITNFWRAYLKNRLEKQTILEEEGFWLKSNPGDFINFPRINHVHHSKTSAPFFPPDCWFRVTFCLIFPPPPDLQFHIFIFKLIWRSANPLPPLGMKNTEESRDDNALIEHCDD